MFSNLVFVEIIS